MIVTSITIAKGRVHCASDWQGSPKVYTACCIICALRGFEPYKEIEGSGERGVHSAVADDRIPFDILQSLYAV